MILTKPVQNISGMMAVVVNFFQTWTNLTVATCFLVVLYL